jgi:hypothetical protein
MYRDEEGAYACAAAGRIRRVVVDICVSTGGGVSILRSFWNVSRERRGRDGPVWRRSSVVSLLLRVVCHLSGKRGGR